MDYDIRPEELLLNIVEHFEREKELREQTFTSTSLLSHGFEIMLLSICLRCALTHPIVDQSSIPPIVAGSILSE